MPELSRRRAASGSELALGLFFAASSVTYVRSQEWPGAWLLLVPVLAGLLTELDGIGDGLRRRGERDAWILVGLAAVVGIGWTLYALVSENLLALLRGVIGSGLVLMGSFFAAGRRVWRPGRGLIPTGLAALALAGLDSFAPVVLPGGVAVLALVVRLGIERTTRRPLGAPARAPIGLVLFTLLAGGLAAGVGVGLPLAQPLVERAAAEVLSSGNDAVSGQSGSARLGDIENLALSREVVLRLWSDRPLRLRVQALNHFDGRTWTGAAGSPAPLPRLRPEPAGWLGARLAELPGQSFGHPDRLPENLQWARMLVAQSERGRLVTPQGPRIVRLAGGTPLLDAAAGLVQTPFWPPARLFGIAHAPRPSAPPTAQERRAALQLPGTPDARLAALAAELTDGAESDRERLRRTLRWIGDCCDYTLEVGDFRTEHPVAEFLFEKKRGYCEYFASSAVMLLRLQGIPARYVSGFNVRDLSRRGDYYLVRAGDAHAWVEAWIDGEGWVEADPTPAAQFDALREGMDDGPFARAWEAMAAFLGELQARFAREGAGTLRWLGQRAAALAGHLWSARRVELAGLVALALALIAWRRRRLRRRLLPGPSVIAPPASVDPALAALVTRLEKRWSELGHPRPPHRPPLEHLQSLPEDGIPTPVQEAGRDLVDCYYRARYGGRSPGPGTLERLRRALDES